MVIHLAANEPTQAPKKLKTDTLHKKGTPNDSSKGVPKDTNKALTKMNANKEETLRNGAGAYKT
jgi:hypothetical protein